MGSELQYNIIQLASRRVLTQDSTLQFRLNKHALTFKITIFCTLLNSKNINYALID